MNKLKMIAFDYDRVLTDENLNFDTSLLPYINDLKNNGIKTGIITGRRWKYIEKMKNIFDFIVYENGFFLYYNSHIKLYNEIQENIAKKAKEILVSSNMDCIFGEFLISCTFDKLDGIIKIKDLLGDIEIITNIDRFLILPKGINKGSALKYVLKLFNINEKNVAVVGDGENDVSMFEIAGFPACIGNSIEKLRSISKFCAEEKYSKGTLKILSTLKEWDYKI